MPGVHISSGWLCLAQVQTHIFLLLEGGGALGGDGLVCVLVRQYRDDVELPATCHPYYFQGR